MEFESLKEVQKKNLIKIFMVEILAYIFYLFWALTEGIDIIQEPTIHWKLNLLFQIERSGGCLLISHL